MIPNSISVEEFLKLKGVNIIDIRSIESFNNNHIENAINIPYDKLIKKPNILDRNKIYYIYCMKGITSLKVCNYLRSIGYNVVNIIGGYEEWITKK